MTASHVLVLALWALGFNALLPLAAAAPPSQLLSSDAEWYAGVLERSSTPPELAPDPSLGVDLLPPIELGVIRLVAVTAEVLHVDLLDLSVGLSFLAAVLFPIALYWLGRRALGDPSSALVLGASAVIPVHALGLTEFGFQATGFVPRDPALCVALVIIGIWLRQTRTTVAGAAPYLMCGVLANAYSMLFAHLALTLLVADLVRGRGPRVTHVIYGGAFALGALPTIVAILTSVRFNTPLDREVLEVRERDLLLVSVGPALQYLRRVVTYALLLGALLALSRGRSTPHERERLAPWVALGLAAFALSLAGVVLENTTSLARYLLSRTSVFFILSCMIGCLLLMPAALRERRWRRWKAAGLLAALAVFAIQSNLPTVYRQLSDAVGGRATQARFHDALAVLAASTQRTDVVMSTADEFADLAASTRIYARRPIYVSFKDVGIGLYDGQRGRELYDRWRAAQAAIASRDPVRIAAFMRSQGITALLVPEDRVGATTSERSLTSPGFVILFARGPTSRALGDNENVTDRGSTGTDDPLDHP